VTNTRALWIAWCIAWFHIWLAIGSFVAHLAWICAAVALLAILIPVGSAPPHVITGRQWPPARSGRAR